MPKKFTIAVYFYIQGEIVSLFLFCNTLMSNMWRYVTTVAYQSRLYIKTKEYKYNNNPTWTKNGLDEITQTRSLTGIWFIIVQVYILYNVYIYVMYIYIYSDIYVLLCTFVPFFSSSFFTFTYTFYLSKNDCRGPWCVLCMMKYHFNSSKFNAS